MDSATARDSKASFVAPYLYRIGERYPQKGPVLGIFMRSLTEYIGLVGIGVSGLIVLIAVGLLVLAVILMGVGAYESATNPNIGNQTRSGICTIAIEYQQCAGRDLWCGGQCDWRAINSGYHIPKLGSTSFSNDYNMRKILNNPLLNFLKMSLAKFWFK